MNNMLQADLVANTFTQGIKTVLDSVLTRTADRGHLRQLDADFRERWMELGEVMVGALCKEAGAHIRRDAVVPCSGCQGPMAFKQNRSFELRTALTGVPQTVQSPYFICKKCRVGRLVLRDRLGLDTDGMTEALRDKAAFAGTIEPYEAASEKVLMQLAGLDVSGSKIHGLCQEFGEVARELLESGTAVEVKQVGPNDTVYVMVDGGMVHVDGSWHEVKVAIIFSEDGRVVLNKGRAELVARQVLVTRGTREDLGPMVYEALRKWLPPNIHGEPTIRGRVNFLSDGAVWARNLAEEHVPGARILLDWYHLTEHISDAAKDWQPDEAKAKKWVKSMEDLLMAGKAGSAIAWLGRLQRSKNLPAASVAALKSLASYLSERKKFLWYHIATDQGWRIGSGAIESAINYVVQQRMKRAGMRWEADGADAMLALRAVHRSTGGWEKLLAAMWR